MTKMVTRVRHQNRAMSLTPKEIKDLVAVDKINKETSTDLKRLVLAYSLQTILAQIALKNNQLTQQQQLSPIELAS